VSLTDTQAVRLKASDQPMFHREGWTGDGITSDVKLEFYPILSTPTPKVYKNDTLLVSPINYTIDLDNGIVAFTVMPVLDDDVVFEYSSIVFTDEEIDWFLTNAGSVTLATVNLLLAWSADAAKGARKESLAGGGGMGSMTISTDMRSRELRETAKAYFTQYQAAENLGVAAEYITEIAWNDFMAERAIYNGLIENL
jgi:hypothetical protein